MRVLKQQMFLNFGVLIFMSNWNFMLSSTEHEKRFIDSES